MTEGTCNHSPHSTANIRIGAATAGPMSGRSQAVATLIRLWTTDIPRRLSRKPSLAIHIAPSSLADMPSSIYHQQMRNLIFLAALATTTCAEVGVTEVGVTEVGVTDVGVTALNDGSMELRYSAPVDQWREVAASFEIELRSRCPDGYEKLWQTLDFNDGKSEYILQARCL